MRFDKSKLKRPHADKALEKFIHNATADAVVKPKKGEGKKVTAKKKPVTQKASAKANPTVKPLPAPKPAPKKAPVVVKPEAKTMPAAKPAEPPKPPVALIPPVAHATAPVPSETPLILQNDIKNGVTLNLYHNLFKSFKSRCQEQGKTPSDLINKFMTDYLSA